MFDHYLITRFNIVQDWLNKPDKRGGKTQTDEWLKGRFELFERYTFPSIVNQSTHDFKWLVLFDRNTPEEFLNKIQLYKDELSIFVDLFLDEYGDENKLLVDYINKDSVHNYIITSRIDSDDAIHRNYMEYIQRAFIPRDNTFITFPFGLQYSTRSMCFRSCNDPVNHFYSKIDKRKLTNTALSFNHRLIYESGEIVECLNRKNVWIEVVHNANLINIERIGYFPLYLFNVQQYYGIKVKQRNIFTIVIFMLLSVYKRYPIKKKLKSIYKIIIK